MQRTYQRLSLPQRAVFDLYKGNSEFDGVEDFAYHLNQLLRSGVALPDPWQRNADVLDSIFENARLEEDCRLFRATNEQFVLPFIRDGVLHYPAFMSTARSCEAISSHFGNERFYGPPALIVVNCVVGTTAVDFEIKPEFGSHEEEILFKRGMRFKVLDVRINSLEKEASGTLWSTPFPQGRLLKVIEVEPIND